MKIRPPSKLQIQFSITFIICKYTIFLLLRVLNKKNIYFWKILGPSRSGSNSCLLASLLRISKSFYGSLWYLRTHLRTYLRTYVQVNFMYVQVIFEGSHPTLKLTKQKMSKIIQVNVPNFFILTKSQKWPSWGQKTDFGT